MGQNYDSILVKNGYVLTMTGEGVGMIESGAIAIEGNEIVAVGKTDELKKEYGGADRVFDATGKAVLPGFVDAHVHTSMSLLRGRARTSPR
jgi:5-methylthioadenosine/S-adenosylhomocysteine deaminase